MRLVFMGTPEFAATVLRACLDAHDVVAVYTRPDAVSGRGNKLRPSPVKLVAEQTRIPVRQPLTLRDAAEQRFLGEIAPDVIVVAAYGLILPSEVLAIPRHGCVNVHASLLPRWRGAAPVQRAILAGDVVTGVSIMRIEEGLDTGPYADAETVETDALTSAQLTERLGAAGAVALLRTLAHIERGEVEWVAQNDVDATYADKITRADVTPVPTDDAETISRKVRAASDQATARIVVGGHGVTLRTAAPTRDELAAGAVRMSKGGIELGTADGAVLITRLTPDGKAEMDADAWARGARLAEGARWDAP